MVFIRLLSRKLLLVIASSPEVNVYQSGWLVAFAQSIKPYVELFTCSHSERTESFFGEIIPSLYWFFTKRKQRKYKLQPKLAGGDLRSSPKGSATSLKQITSFKLLEIFLVYLPLSVWTAHLQNHGFEKDG